MNKRIEHVLTKEARLVAIFAVTRSCDNTVGKKQWKLLETISYMASSVVRTHRLALGAAKDYPRDG